MDKSKFLLYSFLIAIFIFLLDEYCFTISSVKSLTGTIFGIVVFSLFLLLHDIKPRPKIHFQILYLFCAGMGLFLAGSTVLKFYKHDPSSEAYESKLASSGLKWYTSFNEAKKKSALKGGNILIYFSAEWCVPCHVMEKEMFPTKEFKDLIEKHKLILLNIDMTKPTKESNRIAVQYELEGLPVIIFTDAEGIEMDRLVGFRNTIHTIQQIEKILK